MSQVQILVIVVASPGDVQAERNGLATVVEEFNHGRGLRDELVIGRRERSPCRVEDWPEETGRLEPLTVPISYGSIEQWWWATAPT
jgi:hypothetical protein